MAGHKARGFRTRRTCRDRTARHRAPRALRAHGNRSRSTWPGRRRHPVRQAQAGFFPFPAKSVILCSGGTGGLFERSLTSRDVLSSAHGIALDAGCSLVNIEFMQMMPGLVSPARGIVFNEKTFRYAVFDDPAGILPADRNGLSDLLEARSDTDRSRAVSVMNSSTWQSTPREQRESPLPLQLPKDDAAEFVQLSSAMDEDELGIAPNDELRVAMYAHAANGGIRIDAHAKTSVPGLFACGEVTGGMSRRRIQSGGSPVQTAWFLDGLPARAPRIKAPQHRPVSMQTASSKSHLSASG